LALALNGIEAAGRKLRVQKCVDSEKKSTKANGATARKTFEGQHAEEKEKSGSKIRKKTGKSKKAGNDGKVGKVMRAKTAETTRTK
jgi:hypothetical protein